jgi:hypothetical protein
VGFLICGVPMIDLTKKPDDNTIATILDWLHQHGFASVFFDLNQQLYISVDELERYLVNQAISLVMSRQSDVLNQTIH